MSTRMLAVVVSIVAALPAAADTYGQLEHVKVMSTTPIEITAKLDPGADHSSLRTDDLKYFQRDGDTWARFVIDNGSVLRGNRVTLERRIIKDVKVPQRGGGVEHQPLVALELCIGNRSFTSTLNVSDRRGYTAPLVLGAGDLSQIGAVDDTRQFTQEPACKPGEGIQSPEDQRPAPDSQTPASPVSAAPAARPASSAPAHVAF